MKLNDYQSAMEQERLHDDHTKKGGCMESLIKVVEFCAILSAVLFLLFRINPFVHFGKGFDIVIRLFCGVLLNTILALAAATFLTPYLHCCLKQVWDGILNKNTASDEQEDLLDDHHIHTD